MIAVADAIPFSLSCRQCDAGMEIDTLAQAKHEEWVDIIEDQDGLSWNYLGTCPDCQGSYGVAAFLHDDGIKHYPQNVQIRDWIACRTELHRGLGAAQLAKMCAADLGFRVSPARMRRELARLKS